MVSKSFLTSNGIVAIRVHNFYHSNVWRAKKKTNKNIERFDPGGTQSRAPLYSSNKEIDNLAHLPLTHIP